jgi:hypothetical protein
MISTKLFALAGNATFTVTSKKTGVRFTYKITQPAPEKPHFVKLLTGADNENSYTFFGTIFNGQTFRHARPESTTVTPDAPSAKAFAWLWGQLNAPAETSKLDQVEVHHEGKCCRCGRKLTVPESVESGIGPECREKMGM